MFITFTYGVENYQSEVLVCVSGFQEAWADNFADAINQILIHFRELQLVYTNNTDSLIFYVSLGINFIVWGNSQSSVQKEDQPSFFIPRPSTFS